MNKELELSLLTMQDIGDELKRRFATVVILAEKETAEPEGSLFTFYQGKIGACIGLLELQKNMIIQDQIKEMKPDQPEPKGGDL